MLLGHKLSQRKTESEKQNWCVVLNPIRNEIDKKRVAYRITEVFSVSPEEAADLVENTPIILLDHLTHEIALKVKTFFEASSAELTLTDDAFQKRRFYRTVWPEPPSLSFLNEFPKSPRVSDEPQVLGPDEALDELSEINREKGGEKMPTVMPVPSVSIAEHEQVKREVERWKKAYTSMESETASLRRAFEKLEKGSSEEHRTSPQDGLLEIREQEIKEARLLLTNLEERYEVLKKEYRQARQLFEEKTVRYLQESEGFKKRNHELEESARLFQDERLHLNGQIKEKENELSRDREQMQVQKQRLETQIQEVCLARAEWQKKAEDLSQKIQAAETVKENREQESKVQFEQVSQWQEKLDAYNEEIRILRESNQREKELRKKLEEQLHQLKDHHTENLHELELLKEGVTQAQEKYAESERIISKLRRDLNGREKEIKKVMTQLEERNHELEAAREQLQAMNIAARGESVLGKKNQLAEQLKEKEKWFQELVHKQEKIEKEIRRREEEIEQILAEQEIVEKEIIEGRQVQLHLSDKAQGERTGPMKIHRNPHSDLSESPEQERIKCFGKH